MGGYPARPHFRRKNMKRGKKYLDAVKLIDKNQKYEIAEAVDLVKKTSFVKFELL